MRVYIGLILTTALLALSACSSESTNKNLPNDNDMIAEDNVATAPDTSANQVMNEAATAGASSATLPMNAIPRALRGRWGMVKNDCTSTHGDAKGLMEISAARLTFYESRGMLAKISEIEPTRLRALYNFEGEGQTWQRDIVLEVQDAGQSLIRKEYSDGGAADSYHYTRCAS